jgi:hypothetical protein
MFGHSVRTARRVVAPGDAVALNPQPLPPVMSWVAINPQPLPPRWQCAGIIIVGG